MTKVIIVDDEMMARNGVVSAIEWKKLGMEVVGTASNGKEGLILAERVNPDVIITDVRMPVMDGLEMVKALREKGLGEHHVIFMSGYSDFNYAKKAISLGADEYILKPVNVGELTSVLSKIAEKINVGYISYLKSDKSSLDREKEGHSPLIKNAMDYIHGHYNEKIQVQDIAKNSRVTANYLSTVFKSEVGCSLVNWLTNFRVEKAKEILSTKMDLKIYEVSDMVGFTDYKYFVFIFKKYTGYTPQKYRNMTFKGTQEE